MKMRCTAFFLFLSESEINHTTKYYIAEEWTLSRLIMFYKSKADFRSIKKATSKCMSHTHNGNSFQSEKTKNPNAPLLL